MLLFLSSAKRYISSVSYYLKSNLILFWLLAWIFSSVMSGVKRSDVLAAMKIFGVKTCLIECVYVASLFSFIWNVNMVFITVYLPMNNTEKHKQNKTKSTLEELLYIDGICPSYSIYVILNQETSDIRMCNIYIIISVWFHTFADILSHYPTIPFFNAVSKFHLLKEMLRSMRDWNRWIDQGQYENMFPVAHLVFNNSYNIDRHIWSNVFEFQSR